MDKELFIEINDIRRLAGLPPILEVSSDIQSYSQLPPETSQKLAKQGFNVEPGQELYHGTDEEFDKFDRTFSRTASHIYTAPDSETASGYGNNVYLVAAKTEPNANLIDDYQLIRRVAEEINDEFLDTAREDEEMQQVFNTAVRNIAWELALKTDPEDPEDALDWYIDEVRNDLDYEEHPEYQKYENLVNEMSIQKAADFLMSGELYSYDFRGGFQDQIMDMLFKW